MRKTLRLSHRFVRSIWDLFFIPKSPRFVGESFDIPANLPASIKRVGVFVNESNAVIIAK